MRSRIRSVLSSAVVAAWIGWPAAATGQAPDSAVAGVDVDDALEEPADPDDEVDIEADDDPNDVGQEGLAPSGDATPNASPRRHGGSEED